MTGAVETYLFEDDGLIPNSRLPLVVMRTAIVPGPDDPAAAFEQLFAANGWTGAWRDGIYPFHHYHSTAHEVLGIAAGSGTARFGGERGTDVEIGPGDVVVIPAGVGHKLIQGTDDLLVVGATAGGRDWDVIREDAAEIEAARRRIAAVPLPDADPVEGAGKTWPTLWA